MSLASFSDWQRLSLEEIAKRLAALPKETRDQVTKELFELTKDRKWIPNHGPQLQAFFSKADLLLYGGAAAGGKTGLQIGLALTEHERSLIMRAQYNDLDFLTEETLKYYGSRRGFNGSNPPSLRTDDGRFIQFTGATTFQWQGQPFDLKCVGADTLIRMAFGEDRPIQDIRVGDVVATLEGPRAVTRVVRPYFDESVRASAFSSSGEFLGAQFQGVSHELLGSRGWASYGSGLSGDCQPTGNYVSRKRDLSFSGLLRQFFQYLQLSNQGSQLAPVSVSASLGRLFGRDFGASYARSDVAIDFGGSYCGSPALWPPLLSILFQRASASRSPQTSVPPGSNPQRGVNVGRDAGISSALRYCRDDYSFDNHPHGEHARRNGNPFLVEEDGLFCPRQQGDAEQPIPNGFARGGQDKIPTHTLRKRTFVHPYTKGKRQAGLATDVCSFSLIPAGKRWLYDLEVEDANHYVTGIGFVNKNCFDEAAQIPQEIIRFHLGWLRSTKPNQRTRAVLGSNPPINSVGEWLIPMFRPWLDPTHPKPARDGELRWFIKAPDGEDIEVDDNKPVQLPGAERPALPMSRTFIRARLIDNPYQSQDEYRSRLDAMDEPYRSAMRDGNFMAARQDQEDQVIPTSWVIEAQKRWTKQIPKGVRMSAMGVDVGAGGFDRVVLSMRYDTWFAPLIVVKGKDAPDGSSQAGLIGRYRRDNCPIVVDVGGGYGGDVCSVMKGNGVTVQRFNGSESAITKTRDGSGRAFENRRAEAWWRFREALNPDQKGGSVICLPDDMELRAELTAVTFKPDTRDVQLEKKIDVKKRLGRSPDKADAVVMAWAPADSAIRRQNAAAQGGGLPARANVGYSGLKRY